MITVSWGLLTQLLLLGQYNIHSRLLWNTIKKCYCIVHLQYLSIEILLVKHRELKWLAIVINVCGRDVKAMKTLANTIQQEHMLWISVFSIIYISLKLFIQQNKGKYKNRGKKTVTMSIGFTKTAC